MHEGLIRFNVEATNQSLCIIQTLSKSYCFIHALQRDNGGLNNRQIKKQKSNSQNTNSNVFQRTGNLGTLHCCVSPGKINKDGKFSQENKWLLLSDKFVPPGSYLTLA